GQQSHSEAGEQMRRDKSVFLKPVGRREDSPSTKASFMASACRGFVKVIAELFKSFDSFSCESLSDNDRETVAEPDEK
ncbi:hypothetical protein JOQ06_011695, partial [Pogonophryne albipinna]